MTAVADTVIVGSGFAGLLLARALVAAGRSVLVLERGGLRSHAEQLRHGGHELAWRTATHSHEDGSRPYPWNYVFGVGGGSLHWTGAAPRLLPSDFTLRSDHGVGRDWPISYDDLEPFYVEAEQLLRVAGDDLPLFPRSGPLPQGAHPPSPVDELAAEALEPFGALPQARPSVAVGGRAACCGNTNCALCPVDARMSMLHLLEDERLLEHPRLELRTGVAVDRLRVGRSRVTALDCVDRRRRRSTVEASRVVLAAGGLENPAILLRSDLDGEHVGRWLFDHSHRLVHLELDRPAGSGRGATHITGASWAYADGPWRDRGGSQLVLPFNQGILGTRLVRDAIVAGNGRSRPLRERVERTLVFDVLGEDLPLPQRRIELSPRRDRLGLPRTRIHYSADSPYLEEARCRLVADLERRFARYGARVVAVERAGEGSHQLGTCFMGERDGVVDADLRHHRFENLFVVGGSAFPSYSAHHPTLTICALALRLGRDLVAGS
jgi:choline dehydrogenase-like flavoprotein